MPLSVRVVGARFYLRDIATRLPFRFGAATVTGFPLLHAATEVECGGKPATGYAADNLMPKWFDKDPGKGVARNIADLIRSVEIAAEVYGAAGARPSLFVLWRDAYPECQRRAEELGLNKLTGAFGSALLERAIIDALGRGHGLTLGAILRGDALGLRPEALHPEVGAEHLRRWAEASPAETVALRHTVGMLDPLTDAELDKRGGDDDLPRSLEAYVRQHGLRFFKLKLGGEVARDIARLEAIAAVLDRLIGEPYHATLDGNEQYKATTAAEELLARLDERPRLARLSAALLFLEQPLDRAVALDAREAAGIAALGRRLPVIIDESDDDPLSFRAALALGYDGVSTKNCKGVIKSFLNRTLVEARRAKGERAFMSAEDLTNLPIVPLQQDLATVRALGIDHVERNGHHYVRGLDHCSPREREEALRHHGDLYERAKDGVFLRIRGGRLALGSLEMAGYGVAIAPDLESMIPLEEWRRADAQHTVR
jgi:enolase-like protein